jgi:hypothetical protein
VHWRLLTTHAVTTVAEAQQIVAWYRMHWIIEQVLVFPSCAASAANRKHRHEHRSRSSDNDPARRGSLVPFPHGTDSRLRTAVRDGATPMSRQ